MCSSTKAIRHSFAFCLFTFASAQVPMCGGKNDLGGEIKEKRKFQWVALTPFGFGWHFAKSTPPPHGTSPPPVVCPGEGSLWSTMALRPAHYFLPLACKRTKGENGRSDECTTSGEVLMKKMGERKSFQRWKAK